MGRMDGRGRCVEHVLTTGYRTILIRTFLRLRCGTVLGRLGVFSAKVGASSSSSSSCHLLSHESRLSSTSLYTNGGASSFQAI
jgi:hypothetical protein